MTKRTRHLLYLEEALRQQRGFLMVETMWGWKLGLDKFNSVGFRVGYRLKEVA